MPIPVSGTCDVFEISSHAINLFIHHLREMAFRHKRLPPHPPTTDSLLPFPPHFLGTYYPLFRVISITISPALSHMRHIVLSSSVAFVSTGLDSHFPFGYICAPKLTCLCCLGTLLALSTPTIRAWPLLDIYRLSCQVSKTLAVSCRSHQ